MKIFDLPTYPIADGMQLGKRELDEMQWLIDRGYFKHYGDTVKKVSESQYQHFHDNNSQPAHLPRKNELVAETSTLEDILKHLKNQRQHIRFYRWYEC
jgi:hypothetical protein